MNKQNTRSILRMLELKKDEARIGRSASRLCVAEKDQKCGCPLCKLEDIMWGHLHASCEKFEKLL